jgi:tetratricopeptide (TPR) repeat protein
MSLLLDALKRAEQAKKAKSDEAAAGSTAADLSPAASTENWPRALEKRAIYHGPERRELQLTDREGHETPAAQETSAPPRSGSPSSSATAAAPIKRIVAHAPSSRSSENQQDIAPFPAPTSNRDILKPALVAKSSGPIARPSRAPWLAPLVAVGFVAVGVAGWYGWQELSRSFATTNRSVVATPVVTPPVASSAAPAVPAGAIPSASITTGQIASENQTPPVSASIAEQLLPPLLPPPLAESAAPRSIPITRLPNLPSSTRELTDRERLAQSLKQSPTGREAPVRLRLSQSIETPKVSPELTAAYAALTRGDYVQARNLYSQIVQTLPLNLDAQLGLAASSARGGDNALAARHYRRVLELDPRNGMAIAGLLAVSESASGVRPEALEAQLKTLISKDPNAAPLQFALGNLYAGERRWTEAQQAFFEAYRLDAANADYLFNLAVSLDQLNQPRLAFDYYQKSLVQATKTGAQFDRNVAQRRATELQNLRATN